MIDRKWNKKCQRMFHEAYHDKKPSEMTIPEIKAGIRRFKTIPIGKRLLVPVKALERMLDGAVGDQTLQ